MGTLSLVENIPDETYSPTEPTRPENCEKGSLSRSSTIVIRSPNIDSEKPRPSTSVSTSSFCHHQQHRNESANSKSGYFQSRGILAMLAGISAQMLCWGLIMTYGTILAFYTQYLIPNTSVTLIALAGAIPPFCLLSLALPWGRLLDAGHHRILNIVAGISLTGGMVGLAFTGSNEYDSGQYWAIVLASVPIGLGQSIYFLAAPQMAKTWHPNNKGLAMGVTNSGAAIGGVAWPLVFSSLVDRQGFRTGVLCLAAITAVLSIFIAICGCPAPSFQRRQIGNRPCDLRTWWPTHAFTSRVFFLHTAAMCCVYLGILTIPFFIELWARQSGNIGVSEDTDAGFGVDVISTNHKPMEVYLVVTMNACQLPGRLFGSSLCDKIRARKIHAVACAVSVAVIGGFWFTVSSFRAGMVFAALFGLTLGVMVSLPINDAQDLLGHERTQLLGQYAGTVYTCASPFILGGAVASGALVERFSIFVAPAAWCMICFSAGGLLILASLLIEDDTYKFDQPLTPASNRTGDGCSEARKESRSSTATIATIFSTRDDDRKRPWSVTSISSTAQSNCDVTVCSAQDCSDVAACCHVESINTNDAVAGVSFDEEQGLGVTMICNTIREEDEEHADIKKGEEGWETDCHEAQDIRWAWACPEHPTQELDSFAQRW